MFGRKLRVFPDVHCHVLTVGFAGVPLFRDNADASAFDFSPPWQQQVYSSSSPRL